MRKFPVEDTAATILRFTNGAIATIVLSDTAVSPWSWDLASGENAAFPQTSADSHFICGTEGGISLPSLRLWRYAEQRGWDQPLISESVAVAHGDPYAEQMRHFAAVIRREESPITTGRDGTRTLEATLAVKKAAETGQAITFGQV